MGLVFVIMGFVCQLGQTKAPNPSCLLKQKPRCWLKGILKIQLLLIIGWFQVREIISGHLSQLDLVD